jgi:hypothetical protein
MADFNVNNSDFYYTGSTGWFDDFCDRDLGNPSYLYVPVHDDQYNFTGVVGPWPYHNTELCIDRPPTPFFTGDGRCIGCPKIASDSQYLPHRLFNSTYISNEWENIYPTFEQNVIPSIPFLQTGLNVSWVNPSVYMSGRISFENEEAAGYYGPEIDIVAPTASIEGDNIVVPYWETNGAKIHVRYAIRGNNYARLVIGFTVEKVAKGDIEQNVNYSGNANSISVEDIINNYTYSLYYGYEDFGWSPVGINPGDFQLGSSIDKPVFIFDSCAVKNVGKELNIYGPAPGFHIRNNSTNLYTENGEFDNDNIFVRYFAFIKKEGDDEIDQSRIVRVKIDIAGFGHPKGLLGLYYDRYSHEEGANSDNGIQINRLGPYDLRRYSLNWGRGINTASTVLYDLNQYARLDFKHGSSFVSGVAYEEVGPANVGQPYAGGYNIVSNDYTDCVDGRVPPCRYVGEILWARLKQVDGDCDWKEPPLLDLRKICSSIGFSAVTLGGVANNNPNGCFDPKLGRRGGYLSKEIFGYKFGSFVTTFQTPRDTPLPLDIGVRFKLLENLDRYGVPDSAFEGDRQKPIFPSLFSYSFNPQEDCLGFQGIVVTNAASVYIDYILHEHPLFYIGEKQVFATEPNLIASLKKIEIEGIETPIDEYYCSFTTGFVDPGGYEHPYSKMIKFLDNFGINTGPSQPFIDPNSCIPKYIVTTPVSENINYYSGYVNTTELFDSDAVSITGDNSIIVKQLGDIELDMYNIADNNQIFNPIIISNTGLFKEDIDYIYPSNPGNLQGSPSKIIYDSGTNILYNLAPFFGYYKYNLNTKCTTYSYYLNNTVGGDGGYVDLIVKNNNIYISNAFQNKIDVINKSTETLSHTITGVESPVSMALDGNRLYVGSSTSNYISIFDIQNYNLSGRINFLENEYPIKLEILNNKLYTLTNSVNPNKDIVIISGINSITGMYNTYSNVGYKRLSTDRAYSLSKIENNNSIYIGNISGIKIIDSSTDTYLNTVISGFASNIEIPSRFSNVFLSLDGYQCNEMVFNDSDNKIYFIDKNLPVVFVLNTGTNECEKIIDLSALVGGAGGITFESNTNNMYISTSDRINNGTLNSFVILNNRPKANISFSETPQFISQNTYNLNITSNNNQTGILYKSDQFPYISIDNSGKIILPTGTLANGFSANNFSFSVFAGQLPTSGFAYSFDAQSYKIGSTGSTSVLYYDSGYNVYNPSPPPPVEYFLKYTGNLTGSRSCDFDDNYQIIALLEEDKGVRIYNSKRYFDIDNNEQHDILQTISGASYDGKVQMNGPGTLIAIQTGESWVDIYTGIPSVTGSYKLKQKLDVSYSIGRRYTLNRSGNILIGAVSSSTFIYTGSNTSNWGFHSSIIGTSPSISNDGSVIVSIEGRGVNDFDTINVFTGSINGGWELRDYLTGVRYTSSSRPVWLKNEDVILVAEKVNGPYEIGNLHVFTGSKDIGWKFKQKITPYMTNFSSYDISDDNSFIVFTPSDYVYNFFQDAKVGIVSGSKDLGWTGRLGPPLSIPFSAARGGGGYIITMSKNITFRNNVLSLYNRPPASTSFFTYNI